MVRVVSHLCHDQDWRSIFTLPFFFFPFICSFLFPDASVFRPPYTPYVSQPWFYTTLLSVIPRKSASLIPFNPSFGAMVHFCIQNALLNLNSICTLV